MCLCYFPAVKKMVGIKYTSWCHTTRISAILYDITLHVNSIRSAGCGSIHCIATES